MKHSRTVGAVALLLMTALLLSSCGIAGGTVDPKSLFDPEAVFTAEEPYTQISSVASIGGATLQTSAGELLYFAGELGGYTRHIVHHVGEGKTVLTLNDREDVTYTVALSENEVGGYAYFLLTAVETDGGDTTVKHTLYDESGTRVDDVRDTMAGLSEVGDLLFFDGVLYCCEEGALTAYMAWSPLAALPDVEEKRGDYYYSFHDDRRLTVYDKELNLLSTYTLPTYARGVDDDIFYHVLGDGNVMIQYYSLLHEDDTRYTALLQEEDTVTPIRLTTVIVEAKSGKAKEVDCEYLLSDAFTVAEAAAGMGLRTNMADTFVSAYPIEDGYLTPEEASPSLLYMDEHGTLRRVAVKGEEVYNLTLVGEDRYMAVTKLSHVYLLNEKGDVLGEMTKSNRIVGGYIVCGSLIYDLDLQLVMDLTEKKMTFKTSVGDEIYLTNADGDIYLFEGEDAPTPVLSGDNTQRSFVYSDYYGYVIADASSYSSSRYRLYNAEGEALVTISGDAYEEPVEVYEGKDLILLRVGDEYYRLSR